MYDSAYSGTVFACFRKIESLRDTIEKEKRKIVRGQYIYYQEKGTGYILRELLKKEKTSFKIPQSIVVILRYHNRQHEIEIQQKVCENVEGSMKEKQFKR